MEKLFCILSSDAVDISLRRSAAEQLSVVLQGELFVEDKNSWFVLLLIHFCAEYQLCQANTSKPPFKSFSSSYTPSLFRSECFCVGAYFNGKLTFRLWASCYSFLYFSLFHSTSVRGEHCCGVYEQYTQLQIIHILLIVDWRMILSLIFHSEKVWIICHTKRGLEWKQSYVCPW